MGAQANSRSGSVDPVAAGLGQHGLEIVGANLVAQTARAAVDTHDHLTGAKLVGGRDVGREDFDHLLYLQVVVARAQGAKLIALPFLRLRRNCIRIRPCHHTILLDGFQVSRAPKAALHRPARVRPA